MYYLLEFKENGIDIDKITPDAPFGLIGAYVNKLPVSITEMLEKGIVEQLETEQHQIYYKIIGGNE